MKIKYRIVIFILIGALVIQGSRMAKSRGTIEVDQISIPLLTINDPRTIDSILDELMIPEDNPSQIEIMDINKNGFGEKDIIRIFYLEKDTLRLNDVYFMVGISKSMEEALHRYKFKVNVRLDVANMKSNEYETYEDPYYSILSALTEGLERNYSNNSPIRIHYKRDHDGITMEYWGFKREQMHYKPSSTRSSRDLLFITVHKRDTLYLSK